MYKSKIYISGGYGDDDRLGRVDILDPIHFAWSKAADLNIQRNNHRMLVIGGHLTAFGGYGAAPDNYWAPEDLDTIEEYHDDIDNWVTRDIRLSLARRSFGVATVNFSMN